MTKFLMISLCFLCFLRLKVTVFSRLKTSAISVAKNLFNLRNLRLLKDLYACKVLYICRTSSTDIECALQIHPFLTNKANFQKSQMNVSKALTKDYDIMDTWSSGKNKAKTKPIQSQFKPNTKPIQTQYKANTNPNKPNFKGCTIRE